MRLLPRARLRPRREGALNFVIVNASLSRPHRLDGAPRS